MLENHLGLAAKINRWSRHRQGIPSGAWQPFNSILVRITWKDKHTFVGALIGPSIVGLSSAAPTLYNDVFHPYGVKH